MVEKTSAYSKRNLASIPAPIEVDSDPDFNPGAYVPEPKAKRKRDAPSASSGRRVRGQRRSVLKGEGAGSSIPTRRIGQDTNGPNPLLEYFGENLDLHSESEWEDDRPSGQDNEDMEAEEEEDGDDEMDEDEDKEDEESVMSRSLAGFQRKTETKPPSKAPLNEGNKRNNPPEDASETEPDSQAEDNLPNIPTRLPDREPPCKRQKLQQEAEDSVTESDSGEEVAWPAHVTNAAPPRKASTPASDSETESDPEYDLATGSGLKPRPGFPLAAGQTHMGPLVLDEGKKIAVPAAINTYLRDYQREGVKFFWKRYSEGRGGLLGDDMGLGKTIQVISFLSAIMKKKGLNTDLDRRQKHVSRLQDRREWRERRELPRANATWPTCLIIAPSTVVHNWQREFETWSYFEVGLYNGNQKEREVVLRDFKLGRLDVVLTTFDLARRDIDLLDDLPWSCIFVDEVHRVKNIGAKITVAYHKFQCTRRFGLTGTTIQNSYNEMWTILDWTSPGRLGTVRQWQGFVVKPLTVGQSTGATEEERAKALEVALVLKDKLLPNFFLRRTKDIIKNQLPEKTDQVVFCPLTPMQIEVYKKILNLPAVQNLIHRDDRCTCGSGKKRKTCCAPFVTGDVFKHMSILIKLSNHLALILPSPTDSPDQVTRNRAMAKLIFPNGEIPKYGTAIIQAQFCGKWAVLETLLREWSKDVTNKVLIFTKSVKLIEMLEFHLNNQGYGFLKLDGSTKQSERMPMIDRFHSDPDIFVFLISTLAGGTGLNLTGANKVVIFDPNWNPAHDLQAMDRAFRFGQTRNVTVYRLLGAGSVEELIYARQIYKQQQMAIGYEASIQTRYFEGVQGDNSKRGELFGIENIFKLHEDKLATKTAIEKANLAELDWALANMGRSGSKRQTKGSAEDWVAEAEARGAKDDGSMKGLGALLFDDAPPSLEKREEDVIKKTLNAIGVKYSHLNDEVLVPSRIEEARTKTLLKARHRKSRTSRTSPGRTSPKLKAEAQWPPKRRHHKPPPTPEEQLASRQQALIELGMINDPDDAPRFAREFARQSIEAQQEILAELDKWTRMRPVDSD